MCGIAGVIRIHEPGHEPPHHLEAIPEAWLDVLDEGIKHRGPDGQGRFRDRATRPDGTVVDVAFVHRRLSILDHQGGHQPMVHDGDRLRPDLTYQPGEEPKLAHELCPDKPLVAVVFNGCIYNQHELRTELTQQGAWFETDHSDTEVLVHGWRAWKGNLPERLDAMFALGIWDRLAGDVLLGRDAFGEKPLFVDGRGAPTLVFSGTMSSLLRGRPARRQGITLDGLRLKGWTQYGWNQGAELVEGVRSMYAGEYGFATSNAQMRIIRWPHEVMSPSGEVITPSRVDRLLRESVHHRLEADVSLGCFLSGGIDSALIAKYAAEVNPDLASFTVRMPFRDFDESDAAATTARHLGLQHAVLDCSTQPAEDLVGLITKLGLPFGDSSLLPTHWVSRAARQHVRVALSGDGGDDIFLGYDRHRVIRWLPKLGRVPGDKREILADLLPGGGNPRSRLSRLSRIAMMMQGDGYKELAAIFPRPLLSQLGLDYGGAIAHWGFTGDWGEETARRFDAIFYMPEDLLRKSDSASMAASLEVRTPFLARSVAQPALNAPLHTLMPNNERKGLLKQVARQYLPDHIVDRSKQGFAIPIGQWFRDDYGGLRQLLYDHLESADPFPGLASAGVEINMGFVRQMLREHDAAGERSINPWHGRDHSQRLYMLLVLSIWARWLDGLRPAEPSDES
ncbi:hypothetical protein AY599_23380 [Leptolyngbya valderiana BDU 20041]|nr:hypothetical protein AY599_23380 [Leptolyngbya valderiana BDU 20041]